MRKKSAKQISEIHENRVLEPFLPKIDDFDTFVRGFYIQIPFKMKIFENREENSNLKNSFEECCRGLERSRFLRF